jgi:hypothetical protein
MSPPLRGALTTPPRRAPGGALTRLPPTGTGRH